MTDESTRCSCRLRIRSDPSELAEVRRQVRRVAAAVGFDEREVADIILATDEALANVIRHGYGGPCDAPIDIRVEQTGSEPARALHVVIRDFGRQFDPGEITGRSLDDVRPGGLGVHIMKSVMDAVSYTPADGGGMALTMIKKKTR